MSCEGEKQTIVLQKRSQLDEQSDTRHKSCLNNRVSHLHEDGIKLSFSQKMNEMVMLYEEKEIIARMLITY